MHDIIRNSTLSHCNIPYLNDFSLFQTSQLPSFPYIIRSNDHKNNNKELTLLGQRERLLALYSDIKIEVTSSNTYSHNKQEILLNDFIYNYIDKIDHNRSANETLYLFGNNYHIPLFQQFTEAYNVSPCRYCKKAGAVSIG